MAITGISSIDNKQIIAAGALSATSANQALITSGGDSLQGLYDTVSTNSGSWTGGGGSYPRDITADSILLSAEVTPGDSDLAKIDILPTGISFVHPVHGYSDVNVTAIQNWDSTYETVSTNSASWTGGGGGSVTSPSGTIIVNGSNIEATNSAVGTIVSPSASALLGNDVNIPGSWDSPSVFNFTLPAAGGTLYAVRDIWYGTDTLNFSGKDLNGNIITTGTMIVGGNPGTYTADLNEIVSDLSAQGTNGSVRMEQFYATSPSASNSGVYELAWKKDVPTGQFFTGYNTLVDGGITYKAAIDKDISLSAGNATYSLTGIQSAINTLETAFNNSYTIMDGYEGRYEMGNKAYKTDIIGLSGATDFQNHPNSFYIRFELAHYPPITAKLDTVYLTFEATQSGTVISTGWSLYNHSGNEYTFVRYLKPTDDVRPSYEYSFDFDYGSFGTITNATASATVYSAYGIKELAFKDDLTGGSVPDEVMSAASAVSANSANWNKISAYQQNSGSYLTEIGGDILVNSVSLTGGSKQFETLESITGDSELKGVTITPDGITLRNDIEGSQDVNVTEVAKWNETTDTLSANSAAWEGVTGKQDELTFAYDNVDAISSINNSAIRYPSSAQLLPYPIEFVATTGDATGQNILYVVTGSN